MVGMLPPKRGLTRMAMCAAQELAPRHFGIRFIKVSAPVSAHSHSGSTHLQASCACAHGSTVRSHSLHTGMRGYWLRQADSCPLL